MSRIFDDAIKNLGTIVDHYGDIMDNIHNTALNLRKEFVNDGTIVTAPVLSEKEAGAVSLCAIDGASGMEKMQSADMLVAAATLHDGIFSKKLYNVENADDKPHMVYSDIRLHLSKNDQILSAMRAYTEIAVLGESKHDISIIDGSYLGNFLTVIYALQDSSFTAEPVLEHLRNDANKSFLKGVYRILNVSKRVESGQDIIALAKSDSSREMVKRFVGDSNQFFSTDKMLAEYLLKPGELLIPSSVKSNQSKVSILELQANGYWDGFRWNPKKALSKDDFALLEELFEGTSDLVDGDLFSLYTYLFELNNYHYTYFKPHGFSDGSNPLRIEFTSPSVNSDSINGQDSALTEKAKYFASHINADIIPSMKEPYSQYMVDKDIKQPVSAALKTCQSSLVSGLVGRNAHLNGVISSYRT